MAHVLRWLGRESSRSLDKEGPAEGQSVADRLADSEAECLQELPPNAEAEDLSRGCTPKLECTVEDTIGVGNCDRIGPA